MIKLLFGYALLGFWAWYILPEWIPLKRLIIGQGILIIALTLLYG